MSSRGLHFACPIVALPEQNTKTKLAFQLHVLWCLTIESMVRQSHPDSACMGVVLPFLELSTSQEIKGTETCGLAMTGLVLL